METIPKDWVPRAAGPWRVQGSALASSSSGAATVLALIASLADALLGYPDWLFRRIGHPVSWIGTIIGILDRRLNRPALSGRRRQLNGVLALLLLAGLPTLLASLLQLGCTALLARPAALAVLGLCAGTLSAQRSLLAHVRAVLQGLTLQGTEGGRAAVARIVGRDTAALDEAGIIRAAIESLAENLSDGVVAPLLWCALLGLPGMAFYKAVNTADSMIGHLTPRHGAFGWASARLDDLVNLPASRLTAILIAGACLLGRDTNGRAAVAAVRADAGSHRSPNAGWPEAAMAGGLGVRLAGPRSYDDRVAIEPWINGKGAEPTMAHLHTALACAARACILLAVLLGAIAFRP